MNEREGRKDERKESGDRKGRGREIYKGKERT